MARKSKSLASGLIFPVGRVHRQLKEGRYAQRISEFASIYLTAVLEYVAAEILELSGTAAKEEKLKRINPRHVMLAVRNDQEFEGLLRKVTIPQSGSVSMDWQTKSLKEIYPSRKKVGSVVPPVVTSKSSSAGVKKRVPKSLPAAKPYVMKKSLSRGEETPERIGREIDELVVLGSKTLNSGQKLMVVSGSIVDIKADAIVHPTDGNLSLGGMVGHSIREAGGRELEAEVQGYSKNHGPINISEAVMTKGYKLPAENVIHTHSPKWSKANNIELLETCIKNILTLADGQGLKVVAFPSIGSGNNGFPKHVAAQTILRAINDYFDSAKEIGRAHV